MKMNIGIRLPNRAGSQQQAERCAKSASTAQIAQRQRAGVVISLQVTICIP